MLFHAKAFENRQLTSVEQLRILRQHEHGQQQLLPLDPEKAEYYIFCKAEVINGAPVIHRIHSMGEETMRSMLREFGEIHGWLLPFFLHQFRYGYGKILNECGEHSFFDNQRFQPLIYSPRMGE